MARPQIRLRRHNSYGMLGDPSVDATGTGIVANQVQGLTSGVRGIAAGQMHSCAVVNGAALCWGDNEYGQVGSESPENSPVPAPVFGLSVGVEAIGASGHHTCAVVDGGVRCWGNNQYGQLGDTTKEQRSVPVNVEGLSSGVEAIAVGSRHVCALTSGRVRCWGANDVGQLGIGSSVTESLVPADPVVFE